MPTYAQLSQRNPCSDPDRTERLRALYEGGQRLEKLYTTVLPRHEREGSKRYTSRLQNAQYRNYMGPIVDYFRSMLFVSKPVPKATVEGSDTATENPGDYWNAFREDCDGGGRDLDAFFGEILTDAMVEQTGWIRLHIPGDGGDAPTDLANYEQRKLGDAWLERLEPSAVLDWDEDEAGRLLWAVVHEVEARRTSIAADRSLITERWEYLTPESVETYAVTYPKDKPPKPDDTVPLVESDKNHFGVVPLVCLDLPPALWIANRLESPQLAHFRKVNAQAWSMYATCYAVRDYFVKDPDGFQKQLMGAGYELVFGNEDKAQWSAPPASHFAALDAEIKAEKDEIFRVAHQMAMGVDNNAAAVGRTAESKASDIEITRVVLTAFSRAVREKIEYVYDLISRARGEKYTWSVEGLDDFAKFDIGAFLTQLGLLDKAGGVPSKTFAIQVKTRAAEALLKDLDEETKAKIREEIADGTPDPVDQAEQVRQALAAVGQSSATQRAGNPAAGGQVQPPNPGGRAAGGKVASSGSAA